MIIIKANDFWFYYYSLILFDVLTAHILLHKYFPENLVFYA